MQSGAASKPACTDVLCEWNQANAKVEPARIRDINFYSADARKKIAERSVLRKPPPSPTKEEAKENFLLDLVRANTKTLPVGLSLFR